MELAKNSVWEINNTGLVKEGLYRLLSIVQKVDAIILFPLDERSPTVRPVAVSLESFVELVKDQKAIKSQYTLPSYILVD